MSTERETSGRLRLALAELISALDRLGKSTRGYRGMRATCGACFLPCSSEGVEAFL